MISGMQSFTNSGPLVNAECLQPQESFFLHLLMAYIVLGDPEQCYETCTKYFLKDKISLKDSNKFFK